MNAQTSILFVCTGNTCRSVLAEFLAKRYSDKPLQIESAGVRPQAPEDAKDAIDALQVLYSIDASSHIPKDVRSIDIDQFNHVIAMDKQVANEIQDLTSSEVILWDVDDPWGNDPMEYRGAAILMSDRVRKLLRELENDFSNSA